MQQVEEHEKLEHQRRAADQLDIAREQRSAAAAVRRACPTAIKSPSAMARGIDVTESAMVTKAASSSRDRYWRSSAQPRGVRRPVRRSSGPVNRRQLVLGLGPDPVLFVEPPQLARFDQPAKPWSSASRSDSSCLRT